MKIERQEIGTIEVLNPVGAIVDDEVPEFRKLLLERVRGTNPRVVVSLQDVPYMDSEAIETLLDATDELASRAMVLKLAAVSSTCRELFGLTGTTDQFVFFADIQDAVRSFL